MAQIVRLVDELVHELQRFEPGEFSGEACARLVACFARAENALAAARSRAARRAAECGAHRIEGFADPSEWLARTTGSTVPAARMELETTRALDACPETRAALSAGLVSPAQASEIVRTLTDAPHAEAELLALAQTASLSRLRDAGRTHRAHAVSAEQLHTRQRAARQVMHWRDELGMICGRFRLTPDVGVPFVNRLDCATRRARRAAKRSGNPERWEAHAADAFATMISGDADRATSPSTPRNVDLVVVCDLDAWRRGHAHPGEKCHILGGGPIPVTLARELSHDAFLKAVLHDGVNIHTVAHLGRHIPAELRTALDLGPLPDLDGITCTEHGCDHRYGLEWDHRTPSPTQAPPATTTSTPAANPTTATKPDATAKRRGRTSTRPAQPAEPNRRPDTPRTAPHPAGITRRTIRQARGHRSSIGFCIVR